MSIESSYQTFMDIDFWSDVKLRFKSGQLVEYKENEVSQWKKFKYKSKGSIQLEKIVSYINDHMDLFHGLAVERLEEDKFKEQCAHLRKRVLKSKTKIIDPKWFCYSLNVRVNYVQNIDKVVDHFILNTPIDVDHDFLFDCLTTEGDLIRFGGDLVTQDRWFNINYNGSHLQVSAIPLLIFKKCIYSPSQLANYSRDKLLSHLTEVLKLTNCSEDEFYNQLSQYCIRITLTDLSERELQDAIDLHLSSPRV